ncbi:hypothetical protein [Flammeovirga sp. SubArs3]|uniref:hypothetical protein n=1 Tax=Flammeovirga sp. SubArs3 TaxID=2995316 RepID=UPI00248D0BC3|nr:hypothetical protein [Flammeovirga sp. SubArs3]
MKTRRFLYIIVFIGVGSYIILGELLRDLFISFLYMGGTILFVLLPFILFKDQKRSNTKRAKKSGTIEKIESPKVETLDHKLLREEKGKAIYMTIYSVESSP